MRAAIAAIALLTGCVGELAKPPTTVTATYAGTGDGIYVEDTADGDLVIVEGDHNLTADQALQAAGDRAYADYRAKLARHNQGVYQTTRHRRIAAEVVLVAGMAIALTAEAFGSKEPSDCNCAVRSGLEIAGFFGGILGGIYGGVLLWTDEPPYVDLKLPDELQRPDHVREAVELYNAKIHAPANEPPIVHQQDVTSLGMR